jgi:hypothetical protein
MTWHWQWKELLEIPALPACVSGSGASGGGVDPQEGKYGHKNNILRLRSLWKKKMKHVLLFSQCNLYESSYTT